MTLTDIKRLGKKWQSLLGLSEWVISWNWMTKKEAEDVPDAEAFVVWDAEYKTADVAVNKATHSGEETVIHELLHVRLDGHHPIEGLYGRPDNVPWEVALNALSHLLLTLKEQRLDS